MYITRMFEGSLNRTYDFLWALFVIITIIGQMRAFEKAGYNWWYVIVPFLGSYKFQQIALGEDKGWTFLIFFIPVVGWIFAMYSVFKFYRAYDMPTGLAVVGLFFTPFMMIYLGFSDSFSYKGPQEM